MNFPCERPRKDSEVSELPMSHVSLPMFEESPMNNQGMDSPMSLETPPASPAGDSDLPEIVQKLANCFIIFHTIGCGSFGKVLEVEHTIDKQRYAIKCIRLYLKDDIKQKLREAILLASLSHINIVRYYDSWIDNYYIEDIPTVESKDYNDNRIDHYVHLGVLSNSGTSSSRVSHQSNQHLCIQMELCKTNLAQVIKNGLYKQPSRAWKIFWQIVEGLAYLHGKQMVHRDLKPANILLDDTDCVKICDLGLTSRSTGSAYYTQKDDIYDLALIFSEMFGLTSLTIGKKQACSECGGVAQLEEKENVQQNCIIDDQYVKPSHLLRRLLNRETRPTCAQLLDYQKRYHNVRRDHVLLDRNTNQYECIHTDAFCNKISKTKLDAPFSHSV